MQKERGLIILIQVLLISGGNLSAQDLPPIQLDRPDQTECPFITPVKYIQTENGFGCENTTVQDRYFNYPSILWKYGINEKMELRLITELAMIKQDQTKCAGLCPITVGFKTSLLEEKGIIPKTSFIGHITTAQMGSRDFHTRYIAPSFRFTMQHTLTEKISLAYNLGMEWDGETAKHTYIYTLTMGFGLTERLGCYTEFYGYISNYGAPDHRCDGGFTYLVNNNFMVDLSGGLGITPNAPKSYFSLGVSYRFKPTLNFTTARNPKPYSPSGK